MKAAEALLQGQWDAPPRAPALVGQLILAAPFLTLAPSHAWGFTMFGAAASVLALASGYALARQILSPARSLVVPLLMLAFPGFVRQEASFMTDIPACAFALLSLATGMRSLVVGNSRIWLVASLFAGIVGVSIREFAIAAPASALLLTWLQAPATQRRWLQVATASFLLGVLVVVGVAWTLPNKVPGGSISLAGVLSMPSILATLCAAIVPLLALTVLPAARGPRPVLVGVTGVILVLALGPGALVGNTWGPLGLAGDQLLAGARPSVMGVRFWAFSQALATLAAVIVAYHVIAYVSLANGGTARRLASVPSAAMALLGDPATRPLRLFLALYLALVCGFAALGSTFDRYLYPAVAVAAVLVLRQGLGSAPAVASKLAAVAATAWLGLSAAAIDLNSFAFDGARWRAGQAIAATGVSPALIDAGVEWTSYFGRAGEVPMSALGGQFGEPGGGSLPWYEAYRDVAPCFVVSSSPLEIAGYTELKVWPEAYRLLMVLGPWEPLHGYALASGTCPAAAGL